MKKFVIGAIAVAFVLLLLPIQGSALFFDDRSDWEAAVGGVFEEVDIDGQLDEYDVLQAGDELELPYDETMVFDIDLEVRKVPDSWATWSGGKEPYVLFTDYEEEVTATFDGPVFAFGMEIEPNDFDTFLIDLILDDGSTLSQEVTGDSGAKFFGWAFESVLSMTIRAPEGAAGFAFGEMVKSEAPIPEPSTMLLLGSGLIGLVVLGRKKFRK